MNAAGKKALIALGLATMFADPIMSKDKGREYGPKTDTKEPTKPPIPKGCKEYTIDGVTVVSISEKHAIKKVNKIKAKK